MAFGVQGFSDCLRLGLGFKRYKPETPSLGVSNGFSVQAQMLQSAV